jgi:hypothetical protein
MFLRVNRNHQLPLLVDLVSDAAELANLLLETNLGITGDLS